VWVPDQDLEEDLEATRAQVRQIEAIAPDREEAAHRIGYPSQAQGESEPCQCRRRPGDSEPGEVKPSGAAVVAIARSDDEICLMQLGSCQKAWDEFGWVLQVSIHDDDPLVGRSTHSG
jgi:hypothetical protein